MSTAQPHVAITFPRLGLSTGKSQIQIEANGFTGQSCKSATAAIEQALGIVLEDTPKAELYLSNDEKQFLQQGE